MMNETKNNNETIWVTPQTLAGIKRVDVGGAHMHLHGDVGLWGEEWLLENEFAGGVDVDASLVEMLIEDCDYSRGEAEAEAACEAGLLAWHEHNEYPPSYAEQITVACGWFEPKTKPGTVDEIIDAVGLEYVDYLDQLNDNDEVK